MCGIVGILGRHEVSPLILSALKRLEYRGYDSAGIATVHEGRIERRRALGKLIELSDLLVHEPLPGKIGIGHTRWATHGEPSVRNAHPHVAGPVALVHNGIIENYRELRDELEAEGRRCESDTDTEVVACLVAREIERGASPQEAAFRVIDRLEGAFALAMIFEGEENLMILARKGSPLAIGWGEGEMFAGSDALALAPFTSRITYLEEGDRAVLTREDAQIWDAAGRPVRREVREISIDLTAADKGGYPHFMLKEIHEQPAVVAEAIDAYTDAEQERIRLPERLPDLGAFDRIVLVACGTAYYACAVARYWFERLAAVPAEIDIASEFRYREPPIDERTLAIFVSQSGETADTLAALRYCRGRAGATLAVINVPESSIAREADHALEIHAGVEIGVASTKAFTCQLAVLAVLAIRAARARGRIGAAREVELVRALRAMPARMAEVLECSATMQRIARKIAKADDALFLGRGLMYPIALEGALKLKEISYIHAEGYASGELKHGPIALVDRKVPIVIFAPSDALFDKTISNMQEVIARDGRVLLITDAAGAARAGETPWRTVILPDVEPEFAPLAYVLPAQLLAYHVAVHKGTDVDQPRNLAKSVTVE